MDYNLLREWTKESKQSVINENRNSLIVSDFLKWENQYAICFQKKHTYLHLNLDGGDPYVFFAESNHLSSYPYRRHNSFNNLLKSCIITDFNISNEDRIITISIEKKDIYNQRLRYTLIIELIPRKTNLILVLLPPDVKNSNIFLIPDKTTILECLKSILLTDKSERLVLPHQPYQPPVSDGYSIQQEEVTYPLSIDEKDRIKSEVGKEEINLKTFNNVNEAFNYLFYYRLIPERIKRLKNDKIREIRKKKQKLIKKLEKLHKELDSYIEAESYQKKAELIKINLSAIKKGISKVTVINYYDDPPSDMEIELSVDKSPLQNMNEYFKRYKKSLNGREMKEQQIIETEDEIDKLEEDIYDIEQNDMNVSCFQVEKGKHSKLSASLNKSKIKHRLRRLYINTDWEVLIGRTAKENDELTCKLAKPDDWWFHSRIYQGSHIILRNYRKLSLPEDLLTLCCRLAAWYSRAKHSTNVPVDYTQIRYVTKPHKSPPGYVIYKNQKTMFVNPITLREAGALYNKDSSQS